MLSNVFDIRQQTRPGWADDLKALITSVCRCHNPPIHLHLQFTLNMQFTFDLISDIF